MPFLQLLIPWEFSPTLLLVFITVGVLYWRGMRRQRVSIPRRLAFWIGFSLFYLSLHTRADYYSEHEFFAHRIQHLSLHHLAPFLVMASYPGPVLRAGLSLTWRVRLRRWQRTTGARRASQILLHPFLVSLLFVASILVWLIPEIQFIAMLDWRLYRLMNASVAVTGLAYWWMLVDHRHSPPARMPAGLRVLSPVLTMTPQILTGAILTFAEHDVYPIFDLCGRAFGLPALVDQSIGGLIIWVPASLLEALGGLMALWRWMRLSAHQSRRA